MKSPTTITITLASSRPEAFSRIEISNPVETTPTPSPYQGMSRHIAWLGLTLSVGTVGMFASPSTTVLAASQSVEHSSLQHLPTVSTSDEADAPLEVPSLKHEVKEGDSLWALAEAYKVEPETLAESNQLSPKAELAVGQTLKIPSLDPTLSEPTTVPITLDNSTVVSSTPIAVVEEPSEDSEQHIRETRQRLAESWTELKTEQQAQHIPTELDVTIDAEVSDVSETPVPSTKSKANLTSLIPVEAESVSIEVIGVDEGEFTSESEEIEVKAIPIPVPTPETQRAFIPPSDPLPLPTSQEVLEIDPYKKPETSTQVKPVVPNANQAVEQAYKPRPIEPTPTSIIPQPTLTAPDLNETYQVQTGDTLNSIARRHGISTQELIQANGIYNPNLIKANQTLIIPTTANPKTAQETAQLANVSFPRPENRSLSTERLKQDLVSVQADYQPREAQGIEIEWENEDEQETIVGEAINPEWQKNQSSEPEPLNFNTSESQSLISTASSSEKATNRFQIPVGETVSPELPSLTFPEDYLPEAPMKFAGYIWPSRGVLTSGYGPRWGRMHKGIDIAAPIGTPIVAAADGEVISAGWNSGGYGNLVKLRHGDGSVTLYAHNSKILVRRGQKVEQGQLIAKMGSTGFSTGPHLHFEIHPKGQGARNPMAFLPKSR
ncbi:MAG: peptidoglycan DD-metalloendopeptidase family protein [Microcystaceae cyanobacterium]